MDLARWRDFTNRKLLIDKGKLVANRIIIFLLLTTHVMVSFAAKNDWAEGNEGLDDGASRDFYNRAGMLAWKNFMGDWRDANNIEQGNHPYAIETIVDDDKPMYVEWDVTSLVQEWIDETYQNQGMFLRADRGGAIHFQSREHANINQRPQLIIEFGSEEISLQPVADTYIDTSTYRSLGYEDMLSVVNESSNTLLRFNLDDIKASGKIKRAILRLYTPEQYGTTDIAIYRCAQGTAPAEKNPLMGLASDYPNDQGIEKDPNVILFADFQSSEWTQQWSLGESLATVNNDKSNNFKPLLGKAIRVEIPEGGNLAMDMRYNFQQEIGDEPDEIYFRYYLRLAESWYPKREGGKLPGISGTYGIAGWGGRTSDGYNGWSARGAFSFTVADNNPLAGLHPIGTYCYYADMEDRYGDIWIWNKGYHGFLENNRWYSIEQYLKLNTPGEKNGILRAWVDGELAFERTDIRFRHVDKLKIEEIWMNVYHGGTSPSPYAQHLFIDNVVIAKKYIGPINLRR